MPEEPGRKLKHLLLRGTAKTERYTSPQTGRQSISNPSRNPLAHSENLLKQISKAQEEAFVRDETRVAVGIADQNGMYLEFQSEPEFELALKSLESTRQGIELTSVRQRGEVMLATVFIPKGKLAYFTKKLVAYAKESLASGKPKNQNLVANISEIHLAVLESFWTDDENFFPQSDNPFWWEVWLRAGSDRQAILSSFRHYGLILGLKVGSSEIRFPDRTVVLAYATKSQMSRSAEFLDCIAELRRAKDPPGFFVNQPPADQIEWVKDLRERIDFPNQDAPAVCLLDTGVNNRHLLIEPALDDGSMLTCHPKSPATDHNGHGTEMAGLAIYGDLPSLLASKERIALTHRLESVKILPPTGWNDPDLYGAITLEAVGRAEVAAPSRSRAICMAVTASDFRDRGFPSSWSAELDQICSGAEDDERRLTFVSAGNIEQENWPQYPDINHTDGIHDPAQAWNVVTVGAFTERIHITEEGLSGWDLIAQPGTLSPSSTTSLIWNRSWCIKPDIVMEGGNAARNPATREAVPLDDLSLLTTYWQPFFKQLVTTHGTSAATVQAARMAAILQSLYPEYWPETIRALIINSAEWTDAMRREFSPYKVRNDWDNLLRCYGFGVPSLGRAMWSASNSVTLVVQESLQPFFKDGSQIKTSDMHLHSIPWPIDVLEEMGGAEVEMQVTLSYFVEPSPARRGWTYRHRYASHGLRFAVKLPTESLDEFRTRINKAAREEEEHYTSTAASDAGWLLGPQLRDRGSVHSDRWTGTAGDLAHRGLLAVYPVGGWWKERHTLGRWSRRTRYSLVVSIRSEKVDLDIYTPIANMVGISTEIKI
ncbi:MAG: S8 family peptidase [Syntrophobacteraceae bacterium]